MDNIENLKFNDYVDAKLESGYRINIKRTLYMNEEHTKNDITSILNSDTDIDTEFENLKKEEAKALEKIKEYTNGWSDIAKKVAMYENAKLYKEALEKVTTLTSNENKYILNKFDDTAYSYGISNKVYNLNFHIFISKNYITNKVEYYKLYYTLHCKCLDNSTCIKGIKKKFIDKESLDKYMKGRMKHYSQLFKDIYPVVPKEYASQFTVNGIKLECFDFE